MSKRVPATESLLRARDVVAAMLPGSRYGALQADEDAAAPVANSVAVAPNLAALGGLTDPTRRRFFVFASSVALPAKAGTMHVGSVTPALLGPIQQYIAYSSYAAFSTLHVHLVPGFASVACLTRVHAAWHPETENAPNNTSAFGACPTHQLACLGPRATSPTLHLYVVSPRNPLFGGELSRVAPVPPTRKRLATRRRRGKNGRAADTEKTGNTPPT